VAGFLPASEGELQRAQPGSNRPGVFPREALLGAEKVVYETRPGLFALHPYLIVLPMPLDILIALAIGVGFAEGQGGVSLAGGGSLILLVLLLPFFYALYDWRRSAYAITDQRVVTRSGDDYQTVTFDTVRSVSLRGKSSTVVFELVPPPGEPGGGFLAARRTRMTWKGLRGAGAVASYAQSAVEFYRLRNQQRVLRQNLVVSSMSGKIVCAYCGGLIDLSAVDPEAPRCPRCSAFLTVAPTG
jgi:hypothetical protein